MENAKKIASNTISQIVSRLFNAVLSVVIIKVITQYLHASGYGQYTLVYELVGFFGLACDLGLFTWAVDEMSKNKDRMSEILSNTLGLRFVLILAIGLPTCLYAFFSPGFTPLMSVSVVIATIGMAAYLIASTLSAALQVYLKMPQFALAVIIGKVLSVIYIVITAWFQLGFVHLIIAGSVNNFFLCWMTWYAAKKVMKFTISFDWKEIKRILIKSSVYGTALLLGTVYLRINTLILGQLHDDAQVGVFGVALRSYELFLLIPASFLNSVLPSLSEHHMDEKRFASLLQKSWDILMITGLGIGIGSYIMAEPMIDLISTGNDFAAAAGLLRIIIIASSFNFLSSLYQYVLVSLNRVKMFWMISLIESIVAVVFAIIFTPSMGAAGTAWAIVIAQAIVLVGVIFVTNKVRKVRLTFKTTIATFISGAICAGYLLLLKPWLAGLSNTHSIFQSGISLLVAFSTAGVLYVFLLTKTGGLAPDLWQVIKQKLWKTKTANIPTNPQP